MPEQQPKTTHAFEGVFNFRDVGGLPTVDGGRIRSGVLFRSDALIDASPGDVAHVTNTLGITRLLDLRAAREADADPPHALTDAGLERRFRPVDRGPGNAIEGAPQGRRLALRYYEYLTESAESFVSVVRDLAEPSTPPTLVHCRVGKDRTGVAIAVVLALVGVPAEAIAEDYAITAIAMPRLLERLAQSETYRENVGRLPAEMYSAEAATMRQFLAVVDDQAGGMPGWAAAHGIGADEVEQLRANLVESA